MNVKTKGEIVESINLMFCEAVCVPHQMLQRCRYLVDGSCTPQSCLYPLYFEQYASQLQLRVHLDLMWAHPWIWWRDWQQVQLQRWGVSFVLLISLSLLGDPQGIILKVSTPPIPSPPPQMPAIIQFPQAQLGYKLLCKLPPSLEIFPNVPIWTINKTHNFQMYPSKHNQQNIQFPNVPIWT